jgi:transposase
MLLSMYRIILTDHQRQELRHRTRQADIAPSLRDRLEMVRLCDAGWSVPKIAHHLGSHENTVRAWVKAFIAQGFDALSNKPRGGDTSDVTPAMLETVRTEIGKGERTWSASEAADWVADEHGVRISPGRMRVHLKRAKLSYQRTSRSLKHKQKPDEVAKRKDQLQELEKGALGSDRCVLSG